MKACITKKTISVFCIFIMLIQTYQSTYGITLAFTSPTQLQESLKGRSKKLDVELKKERLVALENKIENENEKNSNNENQSKKRTKRSLFNSELTSSSEEKLTSDAYNFKDLSKHVDPRTGVFSMSYKIVDVSGAGFEDPVFPLSINYSSLSQSNTFGIGKGWTWNLTRYDVSSETLSLSGGGSYKLQYGSQNVLRYYKLKDISVRKDNNKIIINYKDGREEIVETIYGNLVKMTNSEGFSVEFIYEDNIKLKSIQYSSSYNKNKPIKVEIFYLAHSVAIKHFDGTGNESYTRFRYQGLPNTLTHVENPSSQEIIFNYKKNTLQNIEHILLEKITYPTHYEFLIEYLEGGLKSLRPGYSVPAVSKISTINFPGLKEDNTNYTNYYFANDNNYLGFGVAKFIDNEDSLFSISNTYEYTSIETKKHPQGHLKIKRTYNHFHLLMHETILLNEKIKQKKEYKYLPWQDRSFENLEYAYNLPIEIIVTHFGEDNNIRKEITKNQYDNYGNLLLSKSSSGIIKKYKYLNESETYNRIPHLLKRVVTSSQYESSSTVIEYDYDSIELANGKTFQRVINVTHKFSSTVCGISIDNCGTVYKTQINSYADNTVIEGERIKPISLPVFSQITAKLSGKIKTSNTIFEYKKNRINNSIYKKHLISDDVNESYFISEYTIYNTNSKKIIKKKELKDLFEMSYKYDSNGRIIKETIGENTSISRSKNYQYLLNEPLKGQNTMLVIEANGYKHKIIYDSMGREIEKWKQDREDENKFNKLASYSYDIVSQKSEEILSNKNANGTFYNLQIAYKYDIYGRNTKIILPDGSVKNIFYDDSRNAQYRFTSSTSNVKSPMNITFFNDYNQPISSITYLKNNEIYSRSFNKFDGFGNLIEAVDVNGNSIKYTYNEIGNKVSEIYADNRKVNYIYDPIFNDKIIDKSVTTKNNLKINLGSRVYNSIGQLVIDRDSEGNSITYKYNLSGNISQQINRDGKKINYTYDELNRLIEKSVEEKPYLKTSYTYNNETSLVTRMHDETGITLYHYYPDGKEKSTVYPTNKEISYKYDLQGNLIYVRDILNNIMYTNYNKITGKKESIVYQRNENNSILTERYHYDDFGRIVTKILPNKTTVQYVYNKIGSLKNLTYYNLNNENILSYNYEYYKDLNLKSKQRQDANNLNSLEEYTYDSLNNLKKYVCSGALCPNDQTGNKITLEEYTFDDLNNIKSVKRNFQSGLENLTTYYYSNINPNKLEKYTNSNIFFGLAQSGEIIYDLNGNIIFDDEGNKLEYNIFNRLISFTKNQDKTEYKYNGEGVLVSQKINDSQEIKFYYQGNKLINEISVNDHTSYFVDGNNFIAKLNSNELELVFITDHAKSIIRIQKGDTLLDDSFVYTPYGYRSNLSENQQHQSHHTLKNSIGFNGERTDPSTGFQFLGKGYRAYNPVLGRFMQYDSSQSPYNRGGINGYIFAANNPIMKFDPTGENPEVYFGIGLAISCISIFLSLFSFGTTLAAIPPLMTATVAFDLAIKSTAFVISLASTATGVAGSIYNKFARDAAAEGKQDVQEEYLRVSSQLTWASIGLGLGGTLIEVPKTAMSAKELFQKGTQFEKAKFITQNVLEYTSTSTGITSLAYKNAAFRERSNGNMEGYEYNIHKAINFGLTSLGTGVLSFGFDLSSFAKKQYKDFVNPKKQQEEKLSLIKHDSLDYNYAGI
ncbi:RHS repeat domain-containing protein [Fluviispira multicolorata]|uniref:Teneurin-like YD-shell domain-containing protein n=1 Tax=Fluviispira multicolorata TaxID=2654512 RepID=A0A833JHS3_9BACT|nr:RHS repeat-associated core domain-containing protein [Fluviispira multicolorata]KAB8033673.1 hypothetical protein GCL57_02910 [Fluviispira multicolorata]